MKDKFADIISVIKERIAKLSVGCDNFIIAIDGNCGSGKTTLADILADELSADVVHIDDFYLKHSLRTPESDARIGGNIDFERLRTQVLTPLSCGLNYAYAPYSCKTMEYGEDVLVKPSRITIVEGAYSCHPEIYDFYSLRIFLSVSTEEQMRRIVARNGEQKAKQFADIWIPKENLYFETYNIKDKCDITFN